MTSISWLDDEDPIDEEWRADYQLDPEPAEIALD